MITAPKTTKPWLRTLGHLALRAWRGVALLEDTPRRIALGSAVGTFFAFQPLAIGGQMAWGAALTRLLRGNVLASLPWAWVTNPLTAAPIYYGCYRLGRLVAPVGRHIDLADITAIYSQYDELGWWQATKDGWRLLLDIIVPLQLGCLVVGVVLAFAVYALVLRFAAWAQRRRFLRRSEWLGALKARREVGEPRSGPGV